MVMLRRTGVASLLHSVPGKPQSSSPQNNFTGHLDAYKNLISPRKVKELSEEDLYASPKSSTASEATPSPAKKFADGFEDIERLPRSSPLGGSSGRISNGSLKRKRASGVASSPPQLDLTRSERPQPAADLNEAQMNIFLSQSSSQRMYGPQNIHGRGYGSQASQEVKKCAKLTSSSSGSSQRPKFRKPTGLPEPPPKGPTSVFRRPKLPPPEPLKKSAKTFRRPNTTSSPRSLPLSSPLSSPPQSSNFDDLSDNEITILPDTPENHTPTRTDETRCPHCNSSVDPTLLSDFLASHSGRISSRQAALKFCTSHRKAAAQAEWESSRYPTIHWSQLDERLKGLHGKINNLLHNPTTSVYRREIEAERAATLGTLANRKSRKLDDAAVGRNVGYYGQIGAEVIENHVLEHFMSHLRRLSKKDQLVRELTVGGFVQDVLVPEVALLLVQEDMGVGEERARTVVKESASVGEVLNGAEEEGVGRDRPRDEVQQWGSQEITVLDEGHEVVPNSDGFDDMDENVLKDLDTNSQSQSQSQSQGIVNTVPFDDETDSTSTRMPKRSKRTRTKKSATVIHID